MHHDAFWWGGFHETKPIWHGGSPAYREFYAIIMSPSVVERRSERIARIADEMMRRWDSEHGLPETTGETLERLSDAYDLAEEYYERTA